MLIPYACIGVALAIALIYQLFRKHQQYKRYLIENQYVGFGTLLDWDSKDGGVNILVRLIDSPAGRAGIPNNCRLLEVNGLPMTFTSSEDYYAWVRIPVQLGESRAYRVETTTGILDVTLVAEMIQGPIPYHNPHYRTLSPDQEWMVHRGIQVSVDSRTGQQWFEQTQRLSDDAISNVLG